jgi:hypothetical protein
MAAKYDKTPYNYGILIPVSQFISESREGVYTDHDGFGHPVKNELMDSNIRILPSDLHLVPRDATHILWFKK